MTRILPDPSPFPLERSCPLDPQDGFASLREQGPVTRLAYPSGPTGWLVTGFAEARALLADPRFSARQELLLPPNTANHINPDPAPPGVFNKMDAPDHSRYRKLLTGHFTVRKMRQLAPKVEQIVAEQLAVLEGAGPPADLVRLFGDPISVRLMCEVLGIRPVDRPLLERQLAVFGDPATTEEEGQAAFAPVMGILQRLVLAKTARPGDDLVSELIRSGQLDRGEVMAIISVMLLGGFDTTPNMMALGVFTLLQHPDQLAMLRADPGLIDHAVEELLRYLTISHFGATRCALEDVQFGEYLIREGENVTVALNAANRDPQRFDEPDRLDLTRADHGHVSFGHGAHQCIGQNLARSTLRVGYRALFERFPTLELAVPPEQVRMRREMVHYGVHELPVTWEGAGS